MYHVFAIDSSADGHLVAPKSCLSTVDRAVVSAGVSFTFPFLPVVAPQQHGNRQRSCFSCSLEAFHTGFHNGYTHLQTCLQYGRVLFTSLGLHPTFLNPCCGMENANSLLYLPGSVKSSSVSHDGSAFRLRAQGLLKYVFMLTRHGNDSSYWSLWDGMRQLSWVYMQHLRGQQPLSCPTHCPSQDTGTASRQPRSSVSSHSSLLGWCLWLLPSFWAFWVESPPLSQSGM